MKTVAYPRKSSESEDRQVLSIQAQVAELQALAERRGERIDLILDESRSAREPGRPIFSSLLKMIERGEVSTLYAWRLDRLARNPIDGAYLIHHLGHGRIQRIVTPEGTFTGTGNDKLLMQIHFGMATKYVDDLSENVKRGNREVLKSGRVPGQVPLGYRKKTRGTEGAGDTEIDPVRFPIVQQLWKRLLSNGFTVHDLMREAAKMGLLTRERDAPIGYTGLLQLFRNPFYSGLIARGGKTYQGAHTPMITLDEFERAQAVVSRKTVRRPKHLAFLYSGFARCGSCARAAVGEEHRNHRYGVRYVYYRCSKREGLTPCREPYVPERAIEQELTRIMGNIDAHRDLIMWALDDLERVASRSKESVAAIAEAAKRRLDRVQADRARLTDLVVRGTLSEADYLSKRDQLEREIVGLQVTVNDASLEIERWRRKVQEDLRLGLTILEAFKSGNLGTRRELLGRLVEEIRLLDRRVDVRLRMPFTVFASVEPVDPGKMGAILSPAHSALALREP